MKYLKLWKLTGVRGWSNLFFMLNTNTDEKIRLRREHLFQKIFNWLGKKLMTHFETNFWSPSQAATSSCLDAESAAMIPAIDDWIWNQNKNILCGPCNVLHSIYVTAGVILRVPKLNPKPASDLFRIKLRWNAHWYSTSILLCSCLQHPLATTQPTYILSFFLHYTVLDQGKYPCKDYSNTVTWIDQIKMWVLCTKQCNLDTDIHMYYSIKATIHKTLHPRLSLSTTPSFKATTVPSTA